MKGGCRGGREATRSWGARGHLGVKGGAGAASADTTVQFPRDGHCVEASFRFVMLLGTIYPSKRRQTMITLVPRYLSCLLSSISLVITN